jgi:hypothetical protein
LRPVKRETIALPELRPGDTCILPVEPNTYLMVKVVDIKPGEGVLLYVPAFFRTIGVPEFVAAGDKVYTYACPPEMRFERILLEGEASS